MKRKINLVGRSTLTVSLPTKWTRRYNITKGDEITLEEAGNELVIVPGSSREKKKMEISIEIDMKTKRNVRSILGALYRKGYDIVRISYPDESVYRNIRHSVNNLIGYEIMDQKPGSCTINSMIEETEEEFNSTLNKILNIMKTVIDTVQEDYKAGKYERLEELEDFRYLVWKLRDFSMRILIKNRQFSDTNFAYSTIIWTLEKINRQFKKFYEKAAEINTKNRQVMDYYKQVKDFFEYFLKVLSSDDITRIKQVNNKYRKLLAEGDKLIVSAKKEAVLIELLMGIISRIQDMSSSLVMKNF